MTNKGKRDACEFADRLPSNGEWWNDFSRQTFIEAYGELKDAGMTCSATEELLTRLYNAVKHEYGE